MDGVERDNRQPGVAAVDHQAVGVSNGPVAAGRTRARRQVRGCPARGERRILDEPGTASFIDHRQRVERHVERGVAKRPVVVRGRCRDEPRTRRTAGRGRGSLAADPRSSQTVVGAVYKQPLRPAADPHECRSEALDRRRSCARSGSRMSISTPTRWPVRSPTPYRRILPSSRQRRHRSEHRPLLEGRVLLAGQDRQRLVAVVEQLLGCVAVGDSIAHAGAAAGGGLLVIWSARRGSVLGRHRLPGLALAPAHARAAERDEAGSRHPGSGVRSAFQCRLRRSVCVIFHKAGVVACAYICRRPAGRMARDGNRRQHATYSSRRAAPLR